MKELIGCTMQRAVTAGQSVDVTVVAPSDHAGDRNSGREAATDDVTIARVKPIRGQSQFAQPILDVRVNSGVIQNQFRRERSQELRKMLLQRTHVCGVVRAHWQVDIEISRAFPKREVGPAMHREREYGRIILEDAGGSVALVHIEVDDQDALDATVTHHGACSNC